MVTQQILVLLFLVRIQVAQLEIRDLSRLRIFVFHSARIPHIRPPARFPQRRRTDDTIIAKRHGRQPRFAKIARSRSDRVKNRTLSAMSFAISVLRRTKIPAILCNTQNKKNSTVSKTFCVTREASQRQRTDGESPEEDSKDEV